MKINDNFDNKKVVVMSKFESDQFPKNDTKNNDNKILTKYPLSKT